MHPGGPVLCLCSLPGETRPTLPFSAGTLTLTVYFADLSLTVTAAVTETRAQLQPPAKLPLSEAVCLGKMVLPSTRPPNPIWALSECQRCAQADASHHLLAVWAPGPWMDYSSLFG